MNSLSQSILVLAAKWRHHANVPLIGQDNLNPAKLVDNLEYRHPRSQGFSLTPRWGGGGGGGGGGREKALRTRKENRSI